MLDESGSPAESWYRHVIYGWNIYSLYDGQPLPGLAEAIRLKDPARVAQETARIENALAPYAGGTAAGGRLIWRRTRAEFRFRTHRSGNTASAGAVSRQLYERASRVMPGGNTRHSVALAPYPIYARSGSGCRITDVEGEERVDFLNNYTSLILGHAHPAGDRGRATPSRVGNRIHHADAGRSGAGRVARRTRRVCGADPLLQFRQRGRDARHQGGASLYRKAQDREI